MTTELEIWSNEDIFQCQKHTIVIRKLSIVLIDHSQILVEQAE